MKLSRNALRNLANRYRAVLKKCRLLNTFGILLLAGCCVVGRGGAVSAEPLYGQKETSQNASVTGGTVSTDQGASGAFGGYSYYYESWPWGSYSNSATGNSVTITGGTYTSERTEAGDNIAVAGGYANRNADGNSVTITGGNFDGGDIYGGAVTDQEGFADSGSADNNIVSLHDATGRVDFIAGGYANTDSRDEKGASASGNAVTVGSGITVGGKSFLINGKEENVSVAGGFATTEANGNSVTISGGTFNGSVFGGIAISKGGVAEDNTVAINGGEINGDVYGSYIHSGTSVSGAVTISGDAVINGHVYAAGIQNPTGAHLSGTMTITGTADLSNAAIHGYTGNEQASASRDFRLDITGYDGTIGTIDTFNQIHVSSSSLKAGTINGDMYNGSSWTGQTSITVDGSSVVAGEIVNFASLTLNDSSLEADKISGWDNPVSVDGFETYKIDATNTNIKVYDTLTEYDTLNIINSIKNNVSINKIHGNDDSTTNIKSGTVEIYDSIHVTGGEFHVNDTDAESSFVTRMGGDIIAKDSSLGGAAVSVSFNTASSFFNGHTELQGTDSSIDLAFTGGAAWNMTDDSFTNNLTIKKGGTINVSEHVDKFNASTVELAGGTLDIKGNADISVNTLTGTGGELNLAAVIEDDQTVSSGKLTVKNAVTSDTHVEVNVRGFNADAVTDSKAVMDSLNEKIKVAEGSKLTRTNTIAEGDVKGSLTQEVDAEGNAGAVTEAVNKKLDGYSSIAALSAVQWRHENDTLLKRMGDLRDSEGAIGTWARIYGSEQEYGAQSVTAKNTTVQVGTDYDIGSGIKLGGAFSYTDGSSTFNMGDSDANMYGVALYGTWLADSGLYVDVIGKYSRLENEFTSGTMKGEFDNNALSLAVETGWHYALNELGFVEPSVGVTYGRIMGDDFVAHNGVKVEQDDYDSLIGRLGVRSGFYFPEKKGNIYARVAVLHDFMGDMEATASKANAAGVMQTTHLKEDLGDTWVEYGIGANFNLSKNAYTFVDLEKTAGSDVKENWKWTVGARIAF